MLKSEGLGRCFLLTDLQALDITDLVVLSFAYVTNLTGLREHRPEHADLIGAVTEGMLVLDATQTDRPDQLRIERQFLDKWLQHIKGGQHHSPVVNETFTNDMVIDLILDFR